MVIVFTDLGILQENGLFEGAILSAQDIVRGQY